MRSGRRRRDKGKGKIFNSIDMTPLIDLTFLLLITFIITMPVLEQGVSIRLPQGKADDISNRKAHIITLDATGKAYLNNRVVTLDDLDHTLGNLAADDPEVTVLVRADERLGYGRVMEVMKILYKVKITRMALMTQAE